jgi:hypothetical protein
VSGRKIQKKGMNWEREEEGLNTEKEIEVKEAKKGLREWRTSTLRLNSFWMLTGLSMMGLFVKAVSLTS